MPCPRKRDPPTREINAVIDKILKKDRRKNQKAKKPRKENGNLHQNNARKCQLVENEGFNNGVESSARFSIRVMEAMRSIQRGSQDPSLTLSNRQDIAKYIETNYHFDGDLAAQVRTSLSRIRRQGMILKIGKVYHLVGPFASHLNTADSFQIVKSARSGKRKSRSRSRGSRSRDHGSKRRKGGKGRPKKAGKKEGKKGAVSTKVITDPGSHNPKGDAPNDQNKNPSKNQNISSSNDLVRCPPKNKNGRQFKKSKNSKKRKCPSISYRCGYAPLDERKQVNGDYQSESSTGTFITCCEELSSENSNSGRKMLKSDTDSCKEKCSLSREINESISSSSEEENSEDSIYQELVKKNSRTGHNGRDLKRWIKHCRQEGAR